jgi:hypothetical protein
MSKWESPPSVQARLKVCADQSLAIGHDSKLTLSRTFCDWRCPVTVVDWVVRLITAGAMVGVAAVAAVAPYPGRGTGLPVPEDTVRNAAPRRALFP